MLYVLYRAVSWGAGTDAICRWAAATWSRSVLRPSAMIISDGFLLAWLLAELRNAGFDNAGEDRLDIKCDRPDAGGGVGLCVRLAFSLHRDLRLALRWLSPRGRAVAHWETMCAWQLGKGTDRSSGWRTPLHWPGRSGRVEPWHREGLARRVRPHACCRGGAPGRRPGDGGRRLRHSGSSGLCRRASVARDWVLPAITAPVTTRRFGRSLDLGRLDRAG